MLIKRLYEKDDKGEFVKDKAGHLVFAGIEILRAKQVQHFSPGFVERGVAEGWIIMGKGRIVLEGVGSKAIYRIMRIPGYYCCHCEGPLPDGSAGKVHVALAHAEDKSPDTSNPAGYRRDNFFACEKEE